MIFIAAAVIIVVVVVIVGQEIVHVDSFARTVVVALALTLPPPDSPLTSQRCRSYLPLSIGDRCVE